MSIKSALFQKYLEHLFKAHNEEKHGNVEMRKYHTDIANMLFRVLNNKEEK